MADSENSRFLSATTRRKMLFTAAAIVTSMTALEAQSLSNFSPEDDASLLSLWREWKNIHHLRCKLTVLQQNLETRLLQATESPVVALHIPGSKKAIFAHSAQEIEQLIPQADMVSVKNDAIEELRSRQEAWDIRSWELGYNQACEEEVRADRREWELAETLWNSSASSLLGVIAKLDCVIEMAGPDIFLQEIPVEVLRSILNDLRYIGSANL